MQRFRGPLLVLLLRLGAVVLIYALLRIAFVLLNHDAFPNVPFSAYLGGLRFDLSALAWLNTPWALLCIISATETGWYGRVKKSVFHLTNAAGFFFACADLEYYKFTLKRSTADIFGIMAGGGDTGSLASVFLKDYWYIVLIFLACIVLAEAGYRRAGRLNKEGGITKVQQVVWRLVAAGILVLCSRGGLQLMPIGILNAAEHVAPVYFPVVLNTPFTIMMTIGKPVVEEKKYMSQEEADKTWPVIHNYGGGLLVKEVKLIPGTGMLAKPPQVVPRMFERHNVVVIILESFSAAYSARLTGGEGYMPFLDSLMDHSLNFTKAYANGRRSIDGIPAITASIPELMDEAFITSSYAQNRFSALASVLASEGYSTSFFHGGRNGTMGFDGFAKSAGYQRYVGLNEYGNEADYDGSWGIWDRPFLQYFASELGKEQQPFFSTVFTLSSHHPYHLLPADEKRFAGGTLPMHASLRYADDALREFFATASKQPWFGNTLFVLTADHTADIDRTGQNYTAAMDYHVPLLYYMPNGAIARASERVTQHIDILPTVLDLIGYDKPFFSFGSSALRDERASIAVTHTTGSYLAIDSTGVLRFDGSNAEAPPINMTMVPDTRSKEQTLKAAIQQFNNRLLRNELTVP
jgi:Sulfatase